jgi:hypothetical protein
MYDTYDAFAITLSRKDTLWPLFFLRTVVTYANFF